jgi:hypothetical protein
MGGVIIGMTHGAGIRLVMIPGITIHGAGIAGILLMVITIRMAGTIHIATMVTIGTTIMAMVIIKTTT